MFGIVIGELRAKGLKPAAQAARTALSSYRRDEGGVLIIFALFMLVLMLMSAGMAVDIMRFETSRTKLQNTLDRAVLAAADLSQTYTATYTARSVIEDYFAKAGMTPFVGAIDVQQDNSNLSWRTVNVATSVRSPSLFMNMVGINYLAAPGSGTAEERIGDVEISLVLDNSGSMAGSRLTALKPAAKDFVDTMFDSVEVGRLSFSMVPYATTVTAGPDLLQYYNVSNEHDYSYCIDFKAEQFETAALSTTALLQRSGHIDGRNKIGDPVDANRECRTHPNRRVVPFASSRDVLKTQIDNMFADGFTSIEAGVKWGAALLDPSAQPVVTGMIAANTAPAGFAGRPAAYNTDEAVKVLVVMSDGENTSEWQLNDAFRSGPSPTWINYADNQYSEYNAATGLYYIPFLVDYPDRNGNAQYLRTTPWGDGQWDQCVVRKKVKTCTMVPDGGDAVRLTFPELWADMSIRYHADFLAGGHGSANTYYWRDAPKNLVDNVEKDAFLKKVCTAAKSKGVIIYSIAFQAPSAGVAALKNCASSNGHFFDVTDTANIDKAFASIASSINQLRLTQ